MNEYVMTYLSHINLTALIIIDGGLYDFFSDTRDSDFCYRHKINFRADISVLKPREFILKLIVKNSKYILETF